MKISIFFIVLFMTGLTASHDLLAQATIGTDTSKNSLPKKSLPESSHSKMKYSSNGSSLEYNGVALNTNFILPIVRYNIFSAPNDKNETGSLEYFNSAGAGIGISFGKVRVKDKNNAAIDQNTMTDDLDIQMSNYFGINAGLLFSKNDVDSLKRVVFAPTISIQLLDFQIGYGYELGTVNNKNARSFFTVSYGIPLQKLTNTGSLLLRNFRVRGHNENVKGALLF